jgi:hypothetical protein
MSVIEVNESELKDFLAGVEVSKWFVDVDGAGEVVWFDEAAGEFEANEIASLRGEGLTFWVEHPLTGKQVPARVRVRA